MPEIGAVAGHDVDDRCCLRHRDAASAMALQAAITGFGHAQGIVAEEGQHVLRGVCSSAAV